LGINIDKLQLSAKIDCRSSNMTEKSLSELMECPNPSCGAILPVARGRTTIPDHRKPESDFPSRLCRMSGKPLKKDYFCHPKPDVRIDSLPGS
jgi:hypothetical protein